MNEFSAVDGRNDSYGFEVSRDFYKLAMEQMLGETV